MKISDKLKDVNRSISFEFFPPKTEEGERELYKTISELEVINPTFVSITYGAGGSTRDRTRKIVKELHENTNLDVMAHLTCIGHSEGELKEILDDYKNIGIENILALRGDIPKDKSLDTNVGCKYANELVEFIRKNYGDWYSIAVAAYPEGHPESKTLEEDIENFKRKVEAGADFAITQMFFDNRYFYNFMEQLEKKNIKIPVIPGIMPITNFKQIKKFADMCGATIPRDLVKKLQKYEDNPTELAKVGVDFAIEQCIDLLNHNVKGLHFYTLNKSKATMEIYEAIKDYL